MTIRAPIAAAVLVAVLPAHAKTQEVTIGAGYTDYSSLGTDSGILSFEYRHSPFYDRGAFTAALAANTSITGESDFFIGAGVWLRWGWSSGWFVDVSLMPGYYDEGTPGNNLGNDLEFRSLLGLGYQLTGGQSLSVAVSHKSNASISDVNPGADALLLRWHLPL